MAINLVVESENNVSLKWKIIKEIYKKALPIIMKNEQQGRGVDPYFLDWFNSFSPIEQLAWHDIRCHGGRLYPQFPVLNYFIDFANPYHKIGVEVDGAQFHNIDKDRLRDEQLYHHGWRIFRIKGSEEYNFQEEPVFEGDHEDEDYCQQYRREMRNWLMTTGEGVMVAIQEVYFKQRGYYRDFCIETLDTHRIVDFSIE